MGGWKLEVFKMAVYMSFPVGIFYLFNQPAYFEEWMIKKRKEIFPPTDPKNREIIQKSIDAWNEKQERERLKELEGDS